MIKHTYLGLFSIFLVIAPIHLVENGLPQVGDCLMALLILILFTGFIVRPPVHKDFYFAASLFVGYVAIVSLVLWLRTDNAKVAMPMLYYGFNIGVFMVVVSLIREFRGRFVTACQVAIAVAIVLQIAALLLLPTSSVRQIGTFNNPNQLGYWALLTGCCLLVLKRDQRLTLVDVAMLSGLAYAVALSLSKAALVSFVLLVLLAGAFQRLVRPVKVALLALVFVSTTIAFTDSSLVDRFLSDGTVGMVADRFGSIGEQADDSLAGRGYDRIWRYPEYLVFGAGEGAAWRFSHSRVNPGLNQKEMHSTLGTVLFSYGIIGFVLFMVLLAVIFRRAPLAHALYSLPIWAYGMTHQGLRESMLWVFLGLVFGLAHYAQSSSPQRMAAAPAPLVPTRAPFAGLGARASDARPARR